MRDSQTDGTVFWMRRFLPLLIGCLVIVVPAMVFAAPGQLQRAAEARRLMRQSAPKPQAAACASSEDWVTKNVDLQKVRETWLGWYNDERAKRGLPLYRIEPQLNRTAALWSARSAVKGIMEHKRDGTTAYYDYGAIKGWFQNLGLEFKNVKSITFTENIGRGPYTCKDERDCTQAFLKAIRYTFDYYLEEEGKTYRPHFNALVSPSFRMMGLGVVVKQGQYYLTVHFGTDIISSPPRLCSVDG